MDFKSIVVNSALFAAPQNGSSLMFDIVNNRRGSVNIWLQGGVIGTGYPDVNVFTPHKSSDEMAAKALEAIQSLMP